MQRRGRQATRGRYCSGRTSAGTGTPASTPALHHPPGGEVNALMWTASPDAGRARGAPRSAGSGRAGPPRHRPGRGGPRGASRRRRRRPASRRWLRPRRTCRRRGCCPASWRARSSSSSRISWIAPASPEQGGSLGEGHRPQRRTSHDPARGVRRPPGRGPGEPHSATASPVVGSRRVVPEPGCTVPLEVAALEELASAWRFWSAFCPGARRAPAGPTVRARPGSTLQVRSSLPQRAPHGRRGPPPAARAPAAPAPQAACCSSSARLDPVLRVALSGVRGGRRPRRGRHPSPRSVTWSSSGAPSAGPRSRRGGHLPVGRAGSWHP